jgi:hypothetical protein
MLPIPPFPPEYFFLMRGVLSAKAGIHPLVLVYETSMAKSN